MATQTDHVTAGHTKFGYKRFSSSIMQGSHSEVGIWVQTWQLYDLENSNQNF